MKVLLINPATKKNLDPLSLPLGLLSIATHLKQHNHTVEIFESAINRRNFHKTLKKFKPDIIGVSIISGKSVHDAVSLSKYARASGITVVWGGFLPSAMPELSLKSGYVDIISIGEGEQPWLEILEAIENGKSLKMVEGLAYIEDDQIIRTPIRAMMDLKETPVLDFELLDINNYLYSYYSCKRAVNLYASKGCTGHCTFCYNSNFNKSKHRIRPTEYVIREINYLCDNYNVDGIVFNDDLIFSNQDEILSFPIFHAGKNES